MHKNKKMYIFKLWNINLFYSALGKTTLFTKKMYTYIFKLKFACLIL